jgi:hypothetical protein
MRAIGEEADAPARVYFTGGASAVLSGWRRSTIDVDVLFVPEQDRLFRALPRLKESLHLNVELASPADFIPELPGWDGRSPFIELDGKVAFHHYDFYAQALSKIERGHAQDASDVEEMIRNGFVDPAELERLFEEIEPRLYLYPALDPATFRAAVEKVVRGRKSGE